jgi:hypothetical protein
LRQTHTNTWTQIYEYPLQLLQKTQIIPTVATNSPSQ